MIVSGTTRVFATLGNPNVGNPAPEAYNAAFQAAGVDAVYVALEPVDIGAAMAAVRDLGLGGVTITAPFKQDVMRHLDEIHRDARSIGAVNVVQNVDGRLAGRNSDWLGALDALREVVNLSGREVALLGAGGAARGGVRAAVCRRDDHRVQPDPVPCRGPLSEFDCAYGGDLAAVEPRFDVVINATSIGMADRSAASPVQAPALMNKPVVFDVVTRPRETFLLRQARDLGCTVVGGRSMVAHQAVPALEWLTGTRLDRSLLVERFS